MLIYRNVETFQNKEFELLHEFYCKMERIFYIHPLCKNNAIAVAHFQRYSDYLPNVTKAPKNDISV